MALFFKKLELTYEKNPVYQNTYKSIQNILLGGNRTIGCPYQTTAVSLDCRGRLAYCAPKSEIIGNALENSSLNVYHEHLSERERIIKEECSDCIHDYHAAPTIQDQKEFVTNFFWKKILSHSFFPIVSKVLLPFIKQQKKRK